MTKAEIIKGLKCCAESFSGELCPFDCPYCTGDDDSCLGTPWRLMEDALKALTEDTQEEV